MDNNNQVNLVESEDIFKIFQLLKDYQMMICMWQKEEETGGRRLVATGQLQRVSREADLVEISASFDSFSFKQAPSLYIFIDGLNVMCKLNIREVYPQKLKVFLPSKIEKFFSESDKELFGDRLDGMSNLDVLLELLERCERSGIVHRESNFSIDELNERLRALISHSPLPVRLTSASEVAAPCSLADILVTSKSDEIEIEDEDKFKGMRSSPRVAPKKFKTVTLKKQNGLNEKEFVLYDLSQGGMAFSTWTATEFQADDIILVSKVGEKFVAPKISGVVRSIKWVSEGSTEIKVGVQFT